MTDQPIRNKVAYVLRASQTRQHDCHWPGCRKQVTPAMWGCIEHWRKLPRDLRTRLWRAYDPGQEETRMPSAEYIETATAIQNWIAENYPDAFKPTEHHQKGALDD